MEEKIQLFIPDGSYDHEEVISHEEFKNILIQDLFAFDDDEIKIAPLVDADIGAGASWPAFMAEIIPLSPYVLVGLALFFQGKRINENIDAWLSIGSKVRKLLESVGGRLNRKAAFLAALSKAEVKSGKIDNVKILQYETIDARYMDNWGEVLIEKKDLISESSCECQLGHDVHYFRLEINGSIHELVVLYTVQYVKNDQSA